MNNTQVIQMDYLEFSGNMLERIDFKDSSSPGLLEVTGISQHGMATASGLNDYDYQNLSSLSLGQKQLNQVTTLHKIPIPSEVLEHFKHVKCQCMMGLFPEIGRAWLTIDCEIYIWTYEQSRDVAYYDGLNHLIVSVGLVTPKPGVFISDVKHLLILNTPTEIVILGVTFGDATKTISSPMRTMQNTQTVYEEMQLLNKPIFILNTDNVSISVVKGSANGRIFLGGRDGCLYEIHYQAESSWFGKRCKKINHSQSIVSYIVPSFLKIFSENDPIIDLAIDNTRQLLYVLTEKGSIEAWDMGEDCNQMRRIARVSENDIINHAGNIIKTIDPSVFKSIKAICPLTTEDCSRLHLIAITQSGVRLYFATAPLQTTPQMQQHQQQMQPQQHQQSQLTGGTYDALKPQGLYLLHIRLPPGYTPNTTINKPKQVHSALYSDGSLLLVCAPQPDQGVLWSISSAPFPNRPYLAESTTVIPLDGVVWDLAEVKDRARIALSTVLRKAQNSRKVVLLTSQGAHIISLLQPADILEQLLIACNGPHHEAVKAYFQAQSEREACATCLLLACSDKCRGTDIAIWAAQAYILYGGEPTYQLSSLNPPARSIMQSPSSGGRMNESNTPTLGGTIQDRNQSQVFFSTPVSGRNVSTIQHNLMQQTQFPMSPITPNQTMPPTVGPDLSNVIYSAKHDGLYLYISRLVRPIWKKRCIDRNLSSTLTQADCTILLEDLHSVKGFLEANATTDITSSLRGLTQSTITQAWQMPNNNEQRNILEQVQVEEKRSLIALNYLIRHICEVIGLWKILCEHQFQLLINQLSKEQQNILLSCIFRDLILSKTDTCAFLIVAIINSYLKDNASVSTISAKLRNVCPNLYRQEDAVSFKATEILIQSKTCATPEEKEEKLTTALRMCKDAAPNLPLTNICQQFTLADFYQGVIELTVACATKLDQEGFALHYYRNNEPVEDRDGSEAFAARMNCYKEVKQMLDIVYQNVCNASTNAEFNLTNNMDVREKNVNEQVMKIVDMSLQAADPLLHFVVYEWLLTHSMLSELLILSKPSLGEFLRISVIRYPEDVRLTDLLWKYYEKNGQHGAAAKILDNLASMQTNAIPLMQRIDYLARAVMCMRNDNTGYSMHSDVLLKDLEDKLEIARVQKTILDALVNSENPKAQEAATTLNYGLYDMTQLYSKYADPFDLWECKLVILNCSHHNDPLLIESVWAQILNKEFEKPGSEQEKCTRLLTKVQSLVQQFGDSGHCFPLAFLVRELEIKCCKLGGGIIPKALVEMKLDIELLIDLYLKMISMNERIWEKEGNPLQLIQSAKALMDLLVQNSYHIPNRNKRRIVAKAEDLLSQCLHLLYPRPGNEILTESLKELQIKLKRLL